MQINSVQGFTSSKNIDSSLPNDLGTAKNTSFSSKAVGITEHVKKFKEAIGEEDFDKIVNKVKDINSDLRYTRFEFKIHDVTKRVMVKIYDKTSDELISEVPPEKFLDLLAGIWEQAGLIVDEKI